jgi:hypothetical protein
MRKVLNVRENAVAFCPTVVIIVLAPVKTATSLTASDNTSPALKLAANRSKHVLIGAAESVIQEPTAAPAHQSANSDAVMLNVGEGAASCALLVRNPVLGVVNTEDYAECPVVPPAIDYPAIGDASSN